MNHLTDYSQAWDREGERADALKERRDSITLESTATLEALKDVVATAIAGLDRATLVERLAYAMALNWGESNQSDWAEHDRMCLRADEASEVAGILKRDVDARMIIEGDRNEH